MVSMVEPWCVKAFARVALRRAQGDSRRFCLRYNKERKVSW